MSQKKSFMDNPALQFISTVAEQESGIEKNMEEQEIETYQEQIEKATDETTQISNETNQVADTLKAQPEQIQPQHDVSEAAEIAAIAATPPVPMKPNPLYIETKSKRVQLLMQPSLYQKLKDKATKEKTSVNDLVHSILLHTMDNNG